MTNLTPYLVSLWLLWPPSPETNVVGYHISVNSLVYTTDAAAFQATNLPPGHYSFCVSAFDAYGLESEPVCVRTNLPKMNWVVITNTLEVSTNLSNWGTEKTVVWTNVFDGQRFFRSRLNTWWP